jgi:ribonuclease HI
MHYKIFADGSSRGNPGPGGWGAIIIEDATKIIELGGAEKNTTNNRMELTAAAKAFHTLAGLTAKNPASAAIEIFTDSSYLINGITKWINGWKKNGWKTKTKADVLNKDLWVELHDLTKSYNIKWHHVGGHVGIAGNERCDEIATEYADGEKVSLYRGDLSLYHHKNILDMKYDPEKVMQKKSTTERSRAKAYSYVSRVDGIIKIHRDWTECERRVRGAKGAKYRKSLDKEDEDRIVTEFS